MVQATVPKGPTPTQAPIIKPEPVVKQEPDDDVQDGTGTRGPRRSRRLAAGNSVQN